MINSQISKTDFMKISFVNLTDSILTSGNFSLRLKKHLRIKKYNLVTISTKCDFRCF